MFLVILKNRNLKTTTRKLTVAPCWQLVEDRATAILMEADNKTLMEKLRLFDTMEGKGKQSLYHIIDTFIAKKKLKVNLTSVL